MRADYIVVGAGLTGATIARLLTDAGRDVLVLDRRAHAGGNVHDHVHESGVRIHTYGPHCFRTNDDAMWAFVNRFARFRPFEAQVQTLVRGQYQHWPINARYIRETIGEDWQPAFTGTARNFEEACLSMMPRAVYEDFVKGYTEKQWGMSATSLSPALAKRFDVRAEDDSRFSTHRHQGLPEAGYAAFMDSLLAGIPLVLDCDYLHERGAFEAARTLIFTGPIDEYFGFDLGRLGWRGQIREHTWLRDVDEALPCGQVNNPDPANGAHIRTLEWKHMMSREECAGVAGTVLTREFPHSPEDPGAFEYPVPDDRNAALHEAYRTRAESILGVLVCGRLGDYRYYDMDQAIARAMLHARRLLAA